MSRIKHDRGFDRRSVTDEQGRKCIEFSAVVRRDKSQGDNENAILAAGVSNIVRSTVARAAEKMSYNPTAKFGITLTSEEIATNMARHGTGDITMRARVYPKETEIVFTTPAPVINFDLHATIVDYEVNVLGKTGGEYEAEVLKRSLERQEGGGEETGMAGLGMGICAAYAKKPWSENFTFQNVTIGGQNNQQFRIVIPREVVIEGV